LGVTVTPEDFLAYVAATVAHPRYTEAFKDDLATPGIRVPLTGAYDVWAEAVGVGREVLWLHTYGERFTDPSAGRLASPPRLPAGERPKVLVGIPDTKEAMPDDLDYDADTQTLKVGAGRIGPVPERVWLYDVNGMKVLRKWFGYRQKTRPKIQKASSALDDIRPTAWSPDMTTELLNLLNILGGLVALEERQADLLDRVLAGPQVSVTDLEAAGILPVPDEARKAQKQGAEETANPGLF
jgi:hypothetical protein